MGRWVEGRSGDELEGLLVETFGLKVTLRWGFAGGLEGSSGDDSDAAALEAMVRAAAVTATFDKVD